MATYPPVESMSLKDTLEAIKMMLLNFINIKEPQLMGFYARLRELQRHALYLERITIAAKNKKKC